jgi:hypothetical protein
VKTEFRNAIVYKTGFKLSTDEANAWVEIFVAYWKAIGEILKAEEAIRYGSKVCFLFPILLFRYYTFILFNSTAAMLEVERRLIHFNRHRIQKSMRHGKK